MQDYRKKITFWLRLSGWLCLLPATAYLGFYQVMQGDPVSYAFLAELIIIIIFAVYLLTTAKTDRWQQPKKIMSLILFAFVFVSIIVCVPLYFAYNNSKKLNN